MKKKILMFLLIVLTIRPENNTAGLGIYHKLSKYQGGKDKNYTVLNLRYDDFYLAGSEIGYEIDVKKVKVTPYIKKDSTEGFEKGELSGVNSLLDTKKSPVFLGVKLGKNYNNLDLELSGYRDFVSDGNSMKVKASYTLKVLKFLYFLPSASLVYSDEKYVDYFYGITQDEANLTGAKYKDLKGSFRGEFELGGAMFFSQQSGVYFSYNVEALNAKNFNDSLIKHLANKSFTLVCFYRF